MKRLTLYFRTTSILLSGLCFKTATVNEDWMCLSHHRIHWHVHQHCPHHVPTLCCLCISWYRGKSPNRPPQIQKRSRETVQAETGARRWHRWLQTHMTRTPSHHRPPTAEQHHHARQQQQAVSSLTTDQRSVVGCSNRGKAPALFHSQQRRVKCWGVTVHIPGQACALQSWRRCLRASLTCPSFTDLCPPVSKSPPPSRKTSKAVSMATAHCTHPE